MTRRRSGILLHLTSIPSRYGVGDLGDGAYRFADFLAEAGQSLWQILPLTPTSLLSGNSPYTSSSAFAGNPLLISPDRLVQEGFLTPADLEDLPSFADSKVDYEAAARAKQGLLRTAFARFVRERPVDDGYAQFCREQASWLEDYALFAAYKEHAGGSPWSSWPTGMKRGTEVEWQAWRERLAENIQEHSFVQYLFFKQWAALKSYCHGLDIQIIGDVPIYVSYESADVWANPGLFHLDEELRPTVVAGVPPDYFSATGQLWGNPVYRWDVLQETGYAWWLQRLEHNLRLFDWVRLDHFRGFVGYWVIPASETSAVNGEWQPAPAHDFFTTLSKRFPGLPLIAEDLGVITPDVREIMADFGFPGMKVLQFAFSEDLPTNPYAPHNHIRNGIVFTGTHDNNTTRGWFRRELDEKGKARLAQYLGRKVEEPGVHWELIRLAMMSVGNTVIVPMQDVLGLGEEARMNVPSVAQGNWEWRLLPEQVTSELAKRLAKMTRLYGRN
jgi:4-alpha-glucanotransferase